jgi:hypothetical protein
MTKALTKCCDVSDDGWDEEGVAAGYALERKSFQLIQNVFCVLTRMFYDVTKDSRLNREWVLNEMSSPVGHRTVLQISLTSSGLWRVLRRPMLAHIGRVRESLVTTWLATRDLDALTDQNLDNYAVRKLTVRHRRGILVLPSDLRETRSRYMDKQIHWNRKAIQSLPTHSHLE